MLRFQNQTELFRQLCRFCVDAAVPESEPRFRGQFCPFRVNAAVSESDRVLRQFCPFRVDAVLFREAKRAGSVASGRRYSVTSMSLYSDSRV